MQLASEAMHMPVNAASQTPELQDCKEKARNAAIASRVMAGSFFKRPPRRTKGYSKSVFMPTQMFLKKCCNKIKRMIVAVLHAQSQLLPRLLRRRCEEFRL